ncbi:hypothetical protein APHNP_0353 [Anaplasma phagocytophilum str. ApNP]|uniref:Uncharacterized protein n=1 Tax=Anaplasma phagocytophilum str. ApNP TaxID=1359153 RepID=A0A0F3NG44_ANAPH|nr:hypothetical protein APHNP_0353 [Anaplasma phagocytophilum str. ApNP]
MKWPYERRRLQCGVGAPRRPLDRVVRVRVLLQLMLTRMMMSL